MSQVLQQTPAVRQSARLKPAALPRLALGIAAVFLFTIFLLAFFWPFRLDTVTKELADESDSKVSAGSFRRDLLPPSRLRTRTGHFPTQSKERGSAADHRQTNNY